MENEQNKVFAFVYIKKSDGKEYNVPVNNAYDLGYTLNYIQEAIINGTIVEATVMPIHEESRFVAEMFNGLAANIDKLRETSSLIRDKNIEEEIIPEKKLLH